MITLPSVLTFSGYDPTGGAGIQADIEAISAQNCHCCPIITCLTVQDSLNASALYPIDKAILQKQIEKLLQDIPIAVIKIGLIGNLETIKIIAKVLEQNQAIPIILDPVLGAGGGFNFLDKNAIAALQDLILPQVDLIIPNIQEAALLLDKPLLVTEPALLDYALSLIKKGLSYVLITGTDAENKQWVYNRLYNKNGLIKTFTWPRLSAHYHGSGCTLAASIAGLRAYSENWIAIIEKAQIYTWNSLEKGYSVGKGQLFPKRYHV